MAAAPLFFMLVRFRPTPEIYVLDVLFICWAENKQYKKTITLIFYVRILVLQIEFHDETFVAVCGCMPCLC